ncbi:RHS repeat-associated core domain-containing protein [Woeseia oceani]|nr:RHS repeat-associated core domain-containing protein [Woeseia oceani]
MRRRGNNLSRGLRWRNHIRSRQSSYGRVLYNYFRTYDPSTGRYLDSDPIGLNAGLNTYAYVGNMPTMYFDPFGLEPTFNYFPRNEQIYHNSQRIPDPPAGVISVAGHGNENLMVRRFSQYLDARRLADLIRNLEEFNDAKKVTLLSCNVGRGEESLAQRLADELGIPVEGPNKFIIIDSNVDITIADPLPSSVNPENEFDLSNTLPDPKNLGEFVEYQPR